MFTALPQQLQAGFNPLVDIMATNTKILQKVVRDSTDLYVGILNDNLDYLQSLSKQKDLPDFFRLQKEYMENVQERLNNSAKETFAAICDAQEADSEWIKNSMAQMGEVAELKPGKTTGSGKS